MTGFVVEERVGGAGQDRRLVDARGRCVDPASSSGFHPERGQIRSDDDPVWVELGERRRVTAQQMVERCLTAVGRGDLGHRHAVARGADELLREIRGRLPVGPASADRQAMQARVLHHRSPRDDRNDHDRPPPRPDRHRHRGRYVAVDRRDAEPGRQVDDGATRAGRVPPWEGDLAGAAGDADLD